MRESSGIWDWAKKQIRTLHAYEILPPQTPGNAEGLRIGQASRTTTLLGNITNSATVAGGTYTSPTISAPTITGTQTNTGAVTQDVLQAATHGAGAIGTYVAPKTYIRNVNGEIVTTIKVDLTGLASKDTANDVIGLAAGGNAYLLQYVVATHGIIYKMELICLETPNGGDNDINVVMNSSGTLAYDGAGGSTYGINGGDAVAGQTIQNLVQGLTTTHYMYLTAGTGDTAAAYTAGQFLIKMYGHAAL